MRLASRRAQEELSALQDKVQSLAGPRNVALRMFDASRRSTTPPAQRDFWLEFSSRDQEYRDAVRRLARFCLEHRDGLQATGGTPQLLVRTG